MQNEFRLMNNVVIIMGNKKYKVNPYKLYKGYVELTPLENQTKSRNDE